MRIFLFVLVAVTIAGQTKNGEEVARLEADVRPAKATLETDARRIVAMYQESERSKALLEKVFGMIKEGNEPPLYEELLYLAHDLKQFTDNKIDYLYSIATFSSHRAVLLGKVRAAYEKSRLDRNTPESEALHLKGREIEEWVDQLSSTLPARDEASAIALCKEISLYVESLTAKKE